MNTSLYYQYRDASNYKQDTIVILAGTLTQFQIQEIMKIRDDGEFFIPSQVGLEDLQHRMIDGGDNMEVDHVWHELTDDAFTNTDKEPTTTITAEQLYQSFNVVRESGWDIEQAMKDNGLI